MNKEQIYTKCDVGRMTLITPTKKGQEKVSVIEILNVLSEQGLSKGRFDTRLKLLLRTSEVT